MLLGQVLHTTRQCCADHVALWFGEQRWTYADLDDATDRLAAALFDAGLRAADRVALFLPNCPELVLSYFACFKLGVVAVPLNYRYRAPEAQYAIEHSGSRALIAHESLAGEVIGLPLAEMGVTRCYLVGGTPRPPFVPFAQLLTGEQRKPPEAAFDERQPAAILYTSGTTARPKGVTYTQQTLWHNCVIQSSFFQFTPQDVHLLSTAACHAAAFTGQLLPSVFGGGTCVLTHLPTPEQVIEAIATRGVSRVQMLPATLEDLVEHLERTPGADLRSWRACTCGGDVVSLDLHERFRKVTGFEVTELYGMTEALSCISNPPFGTKRRGSIGHPIDSYEMRLLDLSGQEVPDDEMGEIVLRGPAIMVGYWNDPENSALALRDGWLYTGDLARRDKAGWYWFVGRKKEIIIHAGSNISPMEVEDVLDAHPAVRLSCVLGVPDKHLGERVAAFVALRDDVKDRPGPEELRRFVAERIAAYKVPERITIVDALPMNATGKVDRKKLHAQVQAERAAE